MRHTTMNTITQVDLDTEIQDVRANLDKIRATVKSVRQGILSRNPNAFDKLNIDATVRNFPAK